MLNNTLLVVDLEATCSDDGTIWPETMETIEIGACWIGAGGTVIDKFQCFVRPVLNPTLTAFCMSLTGIRQENVDGAQPFALAADQLRRFVEQYQQPGSVWFSWGDYDRKQFERDGARHGVSNPVALPHLNAKRLFSKARKIKQVGMATALQIVGLALEGEHHRALDDALNIARLLPFCSSTNPAAEG